jgi:hypothetical protein
MKVEESLKFSEKLSLITNKTTEFLLPTVIFNSSTGKELPIEFFKKYGFINAYIDDFQLDPVIYDWYHTGNKYLYLLFKPKFNDYFLEKEEAFKSFGKWISSMA